MNPLISVIIPVFNGQAYLAQALESVLAQTYPDIEVVVVDDGSSDASLQVAAGFAERRLAGRLRLLQQSQRGPGAARNLAIKEARGDLLAFLDCDDTWTPNKLEIQITYLNDNPGVEGVFGFARQFYSPELSPEQRRKIYCPAQPQPGFVVGTLLIWRAAFERIGKFGEQWRVGEFVDWYCRAREQGFSYQLLPELMLMRRLHNHNLGLRERESVDLATILLGSLRRRRQDQA